MTLLVDPSTDSLRNFFYNNRLFAEDGKPGMGDQCTGRSGEDVIFKVPPGTLVSRLLEEEDPETGELITKTETVADLTETGTSFVLCKGGKGGKGNIHFKTSTNQAPRQNTLGQPGEEGHFHFELRSIAEAGLVGFPNAGKSTLLSRLSAARPKVANYPFTTLQPMVGVIHFDDFHRGTMADIPGIIEGAHANIGLGHEFLRHIMRCRLLLFVVDAAGSEGRDPISDLETLRKEVKLYSAELAKRPWCIVANKIDLPEAAENLNHIKERFKRTKIIPISANDGTGLDALRKYLEGRIARPIA